MKSDIYTGEQGIERILSEIERFGKITDLPQASSNKLRLLAEEMLSLTVRMFEDLKYEFFAENDGQKFMLNLSAETMVTSGQKEKLISLSSSGENIAVKGVIGKISETFSELLAGGDTGYEVLDIPYWQYGSAWGMHSAYFHLSAYQSEQPKKSEDEKWDGIEKSIIETLVSDMLIGVKGKRVEMIAIIEF
jgi:hypothetical protein